MPLRGRSRLAGLRLLAVLLCGLALLLPTGAQAIQPEDPTPPGAPIVVDPAGRVAERNDAQASGALQDVALAAPGATGDYRLDSLLSGYRWPATWRTLTYSFYEDDVFAGSYYGAATDVHEVSEPLKANIRRIMAWYGALVNVDFVEVVETPAQIGYLRFMLTSTATYARAFYPTSTQLFHVSGDVHLNPAFDRLGDSNGLKHPPGMHGYFILIHEIGHALGLKHPFEGDDNLPLEEDNDSHTVMSYTWRGASAATPMPYDLLALQYLYGPRLHRAGDDLYRATATGMDQYTLGGEIFFDTPYPIKQTLWDAGGANTLDLTELPPDPRGYRLDLNGIGWLTSWANYGSLGTYFASGSALAGGVAISAVIGSSSRDVFTGHQRDRFTGAQAIYGASAQDVIDLRDYPMREVTRTRSGDDLVLGLGANGSITIKGYYLGNTPALLFKPTLHLPLIVR